MNKGSIAKNIMRSIYEKRWSLALFAIIMAVMYVPAFAKVQDGLNSKAVWVTLLLLIIGGCVTIVIRAGEAARESWSGSRTKGHAIAAGIVICLAAAFIAAGIYQTVIRPLDPQPVVVSHQLNSENAANYDSEELEYYSEDQNAQGSGDEDPFSDTTADRENADKSNVFKAGAILVCTLLILLVVSHRCGKRLSSKASRRISAWRRERAIARADGSRQVVLAFREICERLSEKGFRRPPSMTAVEYANEVSDHFENVDVDLLWVAKLYEKIMYGGYEPSKEECEEVLRIKESVERR